MTHRLLETQLLLLKGQHRELDLQAPTFSELQCRERLWGTKTDTGRNWTVWYRGRTQRWLSSRWRCSQWSLFPSWDLPGCRADWQPFPVCSTLEVPKTPSPPNLPPHPGCAQWLLHMNGLSFLSLKPDKKLHLGQGVPNLSIKGLRPTPAPACLASQLGLAWTLPNLIQRRRIYRSLCSSCQVAPGSG